MKAEMLKAALLALAIVCLLAFGCYSQMATWRECLRIHPWWYCTEADR